MIRKAFICLIAATAMCAGAAADGYRDELHKLIVGDSTTVFMKRSAVKMWVAGTLKKSSHGVTADETRRLEKSLDSYLASQYFDDMTDFALPCYRENVTEDQLRQLNKMTADPDIRRATADMAAQTEQIMRSMGPAIAEATKQMIAGGEPRKLPEKECPPQYRAKFEELWGLLGIENMVASTLGHMPEKYRSTAGDPQTKKLIGFVLATVKTITLNSFVESMPESTLDNMLRMMRTEAYKAQQKAALCMTADPMAMLKSVEEGFINWAKANGEASAAQE